jgi:hypothetical protein
MNCFNGMNDEQMREVKMLFYRRLQSQAIAELEKLGHELTKENITNRQERLAVIRGIVPPHWTGWVECDNCGKTPFTANALGEKMTGCAWCILPKDDNTLPEMDHKWAGYCNFMNHMSAAAVKNLTNKGEPKDEINM